MTIPANTREVPRRIGLPEVIVARGIELAKGATIYGVPMADLSRDELLAIAALGWEAYRRSLEDGIATARTFRSLAIAKSQHE